jgi:hypothetical protein
VAPWTPLHARWRIQNVDDELRERPFRAPEVSQLAHGRICRMRVQIGGSQPTLSAALAPPRHDRSCHLGQRVASLGCYGFQPRCSRAISALLLIPERFDSYRAHHSSLRSELFRQEEPRHAGFAALVVGSAIVVSGRPGVRAASDPREAHAS